MVQRSHALAAPPASPSPSLALGAILRHLHHPGGFPPGTLPLIASMIAFTSFLERKSGIRTLHGVESHHMTAFIADDHPLVGPLARDIRQNALRLYLDICFDLGFQLGRSAKRSS